MFEILEKSAKREDEVAEDVIGLLKGEIVTFLEHSGVDFNDLFFDHSHHFNSHEIEDVFTMFIDHFIDFHGKVNVYFVHCFIYVI